MQTKWGTLVIGAAPVQVPFVYAGGGVCKLSFQVAPGSTGGVKIGGAGLTVTIPDNTPGTWLASTAATNGDGSDEAGGMWSVESFSDTNTIEPLQYFIHGTHPGDLVNYEYHQA